MRVHLENIGFNHDKDLSKTGAFHLRRNETQIVPLPEWRRECCSNPECAPAGYVIANLPEVLIIKASFVCDDLTVPSVYVRALEPADGSNVLGHVAPKEVKLKDGRADLVPFDLPLARIRIKDAGISAKNITWKWQFSRDLKSWKEFKTSRHRIYIVLEMPTCPWEPRSDNASNIHVPWTDVLDYACEWAAGVKKNSDVAATKVTNSLYGLGKKKLVRYAGGASYAHDRFDCTSFLQLLRGEVGKGRTLNCEDCATVVSTFSNVVGCGLSQAGMGDVFITHPILLLGAEEWEWCSPSFVRHEVAWKDPCGLTDRLFDACLQVDGDRTPASTDPHHKPIQPANLVFTSKDNRSYKFCLVADGNCNPKRDGIRRKFGPGHLGKRTITDEGLLNALKAHYKFNEWENRSDSNGGSLKAITFSDFQRLGNAFDGWHEEAFEHYEGDGFTNIVEVLIKRGLHQPRELVEITALEIKAVEKASEFLLQLLGQFESLEFQRMKDAPVGDVSFVNPDAEIVLFKRAGSVISIRSVGTQPTEVTLMAVEINDFLSTPYRNITNREEK